MRKEVAENTDSTSSADGELLLRRGLSPHRVALEDYVAYGWEETGDVLGERHARKRDAVILGWLARAVREASAPARVLDVGCAYGNHLFMLQALLGKPDDVELDGVDLFDVAIARANAFARSVPGFANCRFQVADVADGLPFADGSFHAVNLADVLEHIVDPGAALAEIRRVTRPGSTIIVSTPLRDSIFKRAAARADRLSAGRLYRSYYRGKGAELDAEGRPVMETSAGHDHVSEMTLPELTALCRRVGLRVEEVELMSVMSGSRWFDRHVALLACMLVLERVHEVLRRPSWAHSALLRLTRS
jgi:SAM-dependent methyltransferase